MIASVEWSADKHSVLAASCCAPLSRPEPEPVRHVDGYRSLHICQIQHLKARSWVLPFTALGRQPADDRSMSRRNLVAYAKALMKAGVMEEPAWMGALTRCVPPLVPPGYTGGERPAQLNLLWVEHAEAFQVSKPC